MFYTYSHTKPDGTIFYIGKGMGLATNLKTGEESILSGTAEMSDAGFQNSNIFKCLNGKRKSHKGHIFKRLEK